MIEPTADPITDNIENGQWIGAAVSQYEGRLLRYAEHLLGDAQQARDVVQDTFLKLCLADRSQIEARLASWLFTVCRNRALNVVRKEKRMKHFAPDAPPLPEAGRGPAETTELHDTTACVQRLIAGLPPNQQECLKLRFQGGLTYREISDVTSLSLSNVGYLIHTALAEVRRRMEA